MLSTLVYCVHDTIILLLQQGWLVGFIAFNTTFNNISAISWQLYRGGYNVISSTPRPDRDSSSQHQ
jgi:hypothetical protein